LLEHKAGAAADLDQRAEAAPILPQQVNDQTITDAKPKAPPLNRGQKTVSFARKI
jgi:hypothetical protein